LATALFPLNSFNGNNMSEKEKILKMVAEGKITVDDGERLLKAIGEKTTAESGSAELVKPVLENHNRTTTQSKIIIDIRSARGENIKVNLPLKLAHWATRLIPKEKLAEVEKEGFNIREALSNLSDMIDEVDEDIVNITSSNGDRVRIYVERA